MDNINIIRVGFMVPEFKIPDTDNEIDDPIDRSGDSYTSLIFINPDDRAADLIKKLENNPPDTASGLSLVLSVIVPVKIKLAKKYKEDAGVNTRVFCDSDLRMGKYFNIIDSAKTSPSYHPVTFIVDFDGTVRFRQSFEADKFDVQKFQKSVAGLI